MINFTNDRKKVENPNYKKFLKARGKAAEICYACLVLIQFRLIVYLKINKWEFWSFVLIFWNLLTKLGEFK